MSNIVIQYGNSPVAESGYQNLRWQVDILNPFNPKVSVEVPLASASLAGLLKLTGDMAGTFSAPVIVGLQGTPVNNTAPTIGQFLQLISGQWKPHTLISADISDLSTTLATIYQAKSEKDAINGYASLDGTGLVPFSEIPALPESRITGLVSDLASLASGITSAITTAEGYTDTKIATEVSNRNTAIGVETARAEGVEATLQPALGFTAENVANKDTTTTLGTSDTKYPSQKAVKTYVDTAIAGVGGGGGSGTLAGDTDVSITSPANNDVLTYESSTSKWKNKPASGGGGGGSASRTTASISQSLDSMASHLSTVSLAKTFVLMSVASTVPCRLRLYNTTGARDSDAGRPPETPLFSSTQHQCICDLLLNAATGLTWILSPQPNGSDGAGTPTGDIAYILTNLSNTTQTVDVTITYLPEES